MKHLILVGGLGNQMFQYAFMLALRSRGFEVKADTSLYDFIRMHNGYELPRVFGIDEPVVHKRRLHLLWLRLLLKFRPKRLVSDDPLTYDASMLDRPRKYISGYWQSEEYFKDVASKVREAFRFRNIDDFNLEVVRSIQSHESVSLHIRRGDYASYGMKIIGKEYYTEAIKLIKERLANPIFYIFSDDKNESRRIAEAVGITYTIVEHNRGEDSYKDMYLMSQCRHNIIANSSFSWWGAWLNENPDKIVIAPKVWSDKSSKIKPQEEGWILI